MFSPKRCAQLGLGAASFVLVASVAVLLAGAADVPASAMRGQTARATPLSQGTIATVAAPAMDVPTGPALARR